LPLALTRFSIISSPKISNLTRLLGSVADRPASGPGVLSPSPFG
jgi:hypothetical protein